MPSLNVHIYPSPFTHESRMLKITHSLADAKVFTRILIFATLGPGLPERVELDGVREVVRLPQLLGGRFKGVFGKVIRTLEWSWRILRFLGPLRVSCVNAHSLAVLPLCVWIKYRHRARLVYDTHELETETTTMHGLVRIAGKLVERLLVRQADEIVTVSGAIGRWYEKHYPGIPVTVVQNVPDRKPDREGGSVNLRAHFKVPPDHQIFLYQGLLSGNRGIELLLRVFARLPKNMHIICLGFGDLREAVERAASEFPNIHYHPAVRPEVIAEYTGGVDAGIHLIENSCLNHYLCLPNKIWEYLGAGLPVVVSDFPEMGAVVTRYGCGWTCPVNEDGAFKLISGITPEALAERRAKAQLARTKFGWQFEEPALLGLYARMGFAGERVADAG